MDFSRIEKAQREGDKAEEERLKGLAIQAMIRNAFKRTRDGSITIHELVVLTLNEMEKMIEAGANISIRYELLERFLKQFGMKIYDDIENAKKGDALLLLDAASLSAYKKSKKKNKTRPNPIVCFFEAIEDGKLCTYKRDIAPYGEWIFPYAIFKLDDVVFIGGSTPSPTSLKKTHFLYYTD